jgi:3',5'-cyclic AMP phosphodiesterase CpdA
MSTKPAITVLHVSDMQFGAKHRFGSPEGTPADRQHATLAARLLTDLQYLHDRYDLAPDLIVASGDLAEQAKPAEFAQVHDFFVELTTGLGLTRDRVAMVPGNHDVNWLKCQAYFLDCQADDTEPVPPYWPKLEPYATMFQRFYADVDGVSFPKDQPWTIFEIPELKTVVAGLNSVMAETHDVHHGYCGEEQLRSAAARLLDRERDGWLRIGVLHHNPIIAAADDTAHLRDSRSFEEIVAPHLNLVMHGHTHEGRIFSLGPDALPVLCAGSAGVNQTERGEVPNQYQLVHITADGLHIRARRYNPARARWEGDTSVGREPEESHLDLRKPWHAAAAFPERAETGSPSRSNLLDMDDVRYVRDPDDLLARVSRVCRVRNPSA